MGDRWPGDLNYFQGLQEGPLFDMNSKKRLLHTGAVAIAAIAASCQLYRIEHAGSDIVL